MKQIEWYFRYVPTALSPKLSTQPGRARLYAQRTATPIGIVYETFSCPNDPNLGLGGSGSSKDHLTPFVEPRVQTFRENRRAFYRRYGRFITQARLIMKPDPIASVVGFLPVDDPRLTISSSAQLSWLLPIAPSKVTR